MLNKIFLNSNVNLNYDFIEFLINYIKKINYNATKTLFKYLFIKKVKRIIKEK